MEETEFEPESILVQRSDEQEAREEGTETTALSTMIIIVIAVIAASATAVVAFRNSSGSPDTGGNTDGDAASNLPLRGRDVATTTEPQKAGTAKALDSKILLCTTTYPGKRNNPPDGLCDLIVFQSSTYSFTESELAPLNDFIEMALLYTSTLFGLDVAEQSRSKSLKNLKTTSGKSVLHSHWKNNIRHYGSLGATITANTNGQYIESLVELLKVLRTYQNEFRTNSSDDVPFIFVGVAPLYEGKPDTKGVMKDRFNRLISDAEPNIVLFQTSDFRNFSKSHEGCVSNAITVWKNPPLSDQPSFVDTLTFRKAVNLPSYTLEVLPISLCIRVTVFDQRVDDHNVRLGRADKCTSSALTTMRDTHCMNGKGAHQFQQNVTLDHDSIVYLAGLKNGRKIFAFELSSSIRRKMCKAFMEYDYNGGWAMYDMHCNDKNNFCNDGTFKKGFARLHWMKQFMSQVFTSC